MEKIIIFILISILVLYLFQPISVWIKTDGTYHLYTLSDFRFYVDGQQIKLIKLWLNK